MGPVRTGPVANTEFGYISPNLMENGIQILIDKINRAVSFVNLLVVICEFPRLAFAAWHKAAEN